MYCVSIILSVFHFLTHILLQRNKSFFSENIMLSKENFRSYIYIECKRGQTATAIYQQLLQAGVENPPSRTTVFEWWNRFSQGRVSLDDDQRCGRPISLATDDNVTRVKELLDADPHLSLRMLSMDMDFSKDTVRNILTAGGFRKVCSRWVPHNLTQAHKQARVECAQDMLHRFRSNSIEDCSKFWCTEDETWALYQTPNTKAQNMVWLAPGQPKPSVVKPQLTNRKVLLLVAFTADKKLSIDGVNPGVTVDSERYVEFAHRTGELWRKLRFRPTKLASLWWQHDNARCHAAAATANFFARRRTILIKQAPYSPDLNLCDRWVNKILKQAFRNHHFASGDEMVQHSLQAMQQVPEERYISEFKNLFKYCERVIECQGDYCT